MSVVLTTVTLAMLCKGQQLILLRYLWPPPPPPRAGPANAMIMPTPQGLHACAAHVVGLVQGSRQLLSFGRCMAQWRSVVPTCCRKVSLLKVHRQVQEACISVHYHMSSVTVECQHGCLLYTVVFMQKKVSTRTASWLCIWQTSSWTLLQ